MLSSGVYFILPAVMVLMASFLIVRAGAIALMMTGLDEETAKFQALSAFTMTGFTTREAELIVNHPQRRKIISWLMRLGSGGIVVVIVTATTSLIRSQGTFDIPMSLVILVIGALVANQMMKHRGIGGRWESFIRHRLLKTGLFHVGALESVLRLHHNFSLVRIYIVPDSPYIGRSVKSAGFEGPESSVLAIERGSEWIPLPGDEVALEEGDRLIAFGEMSHLRHMLEEPVSQRTGAAEGLG